METVGKIVYGESKVGRKRATERKPEATNI